MPGDRPECKKVFLLGGAGQDAYSLILQTAQTLLCSRVVLGASRQSTIADQKEQIAACWLRLPEPRAALAVDVLGPNEEAPQRVDLN